MGMFDPKKRKVITAIIAVILVLAMGLVRELSKPQQVTENHDF